MDARRLPPSEPLSIRFRPDQRERLEAAAQETQQRLGEYIRRAALADAKRVLAKARRGR